MTALLVLAKTVKQMIKCRLPPDVVWNIFHGQSPIVAVFHTPYSENFSFNCALSESAKPLSKLLISPIIFRRWQLEQDTWTDTRHKGLSLLLHSIWAKSKNNSVFERISWLVDIHLDHRWLVIASQPKRCGISIILSNGDLQGMNITPFKCRALFNCYVHRGNICLMI